MNIYISSGNETVIYAASELRKYLKMMFPDRHTSITSDGNGIKVGTFAELGVYPPVESDGYDVIYIETKANGGFVAGNTPRATLLAVYEYLRHQGCRWLFPGIDGEFIPTIDALADVSFLKKYTNKIIG